VAGRARRATIAGDRHYRIMALLAPPVARDAGAALSAWERELAQINASMVTAGEATEPALLKSLTRLAAEIEHQESQT
jgi:uncharacterized membrane-anchored protein